MSYFEIVMVQTVLEKKKKDTAVRVSSFVFKARAVFIALKQEYLPSHQVGTSFHAATQDWSP